MEGASGVSHSVGSVSSRSDGSEYEPNSRAHFTSHHRTSNRCSFMSKPIFPLSFLDDAAESNGTCGPVAFSNSYSNTHPDMKSIRALTELQSPGWLDFSATPRRRTSQWSSASSIDFTDTSEPLEPECSALPSKNMYDGSSCGLCGRFLSQRSPWGSRRIVRSGDMPIVSILPCWHVYHAECLERATPRAQKHDPPCPVCERSEDNAAEQWAACRLKTGPPRLKSLGEEGPSRAWTCAQARDCVEGALHAPKLSNMSVLSRNRLKRQLSIKGGK